MPQDWIPYGLFTPQYGPILPINPSLSQQVWWQ